MTKKELIQLLEKYSDDTELVLWTWNIKENRSFSKFEYLNSGGTNFKTNNDGSLLHPDYFILINSHVEFQKK